MYGNPIQVVVNADYSIRYINGPLLGEDAVNLVGRNVWALVPRRWRAAVRRAHRAVFSHGQLTRLRVAAYHPENRGLMHYECRAAPIYRKGKPTAALVHAVALDGRDIFDSRFIPFDALNQEGTLSELLGILRTFDADVLREIRSRLLPYVPDYPHLRVSNPLE
jgi:hypothetical protein